MVRSRPIARLAIMHTGCTYCSTPILQLEIEVGAEIDSMSAHTGYSCRCLFSPRRLTNLSLTFRHLSREAWSLSLEPPTALRPRRGSLRHGFDTRKSTSYAYEHCLFAGLSGLSGLSDGARVSTRFAVQPVSVSVRSTLTWVQG